MAILNNLYPPIVNDINPAFIRTGTCKVYFAFSSYNSTEDIKNIQISVINQRTNLSALDSVKYPTGIKIINEWLIDDSVANEDYKYYINIDKNDLVSGFELNQIYKVQLRFTAVGASNPPAAGGQATAKWINDNIDYFSEWSSVCLIRGISKPIITIRGLQQNSPATPIILDTPLVNVVGNLRFAEQEKEYLKSYNIKILQGNAILTESGDIYTNSYNPNEFNYQLTYDFYIGATYTLQLTYTTNNLYTETLNYYFIIQQSSTNKLNANIIATPDEENGRVKVDIIAKDDELIKGTIAIRRASSESQFKKWEDIRVISFTNPTELNYSWYDNTIKSGVWYKYCAQRVLSNGSRGVIIQIKEPVMCLFEDIFLTRENTQLNIKFNPSLNEFKYNVTESQQVTLGGKYPFIKRNSNNFYRSFPIGGLISSFTDTTNWYDPHYENGLFYDNKDEKKLFTSKSRVYGESEQLYDKYNQQNNINSYNDYIYEREFREKVYDFLYANDIKLFRSTTEGNILIKLMNIDFQPVETLGRRLYSFTATAVQIDQPTIENYIKYGILTKNINQNYISDTIVGFERLGQIQGTFNKNSQVLTLIDNKYKENSPKNYIYNVNTLKSLKLEITSEPYVIVESQGGEPSKATNSSIISASSSTFGYIVKINGNNFIIKPHTTDNGITMGYFELTDSNIEITSLQFGEDTEATINYVAIVNQQQQDSSSLQIAQYTNYEYNIGQLYGTFNPNQSLIEKIYRKYYAKNNQYYQKVNDITSIRIEGPIGAILYIKDSSSSNFNRYVLENGFLQLQDDDCSIEGIYFYGRHFQERKNLDSGININDYEFVTIETPYDNIYDIENPVPNGVYSITDLAINYLSEFNNGVITINEDDKDNVLLAKTDADYDLLLQQLEKQFTNRYIYYQGEWYRFSNNNDIIYPIDGIIDYTYELIWGVY